MTRRPPIHRAVLAACAGTAALVLWGCSAPLVKAALVPEPEVSKQKLRVQVGTGRNSVRSVKLEDYVTGAILSEYAPPDEDPAIALRMLQVQAVIVRTYALANRGRHRRQGYDLCATTHCQLYDPARVNTSRWAPAAAEAVRLTSGAVLAHKGKLVSAMFHSDCGGHTSTSIAAWGGTARPYLRAVPDDGPAANAHGSWTFEITVAELRSALNKDSRTAVGSRLDAISVPARNVSGRADTVALHGARERLVPGEVFRSILSRHFGARSLKSTLFHVRRAGRSVVFEGKGFGHGVGLCQVGALARLRAGARLDDIFARYYPGAALKVD